MALLLGQGSLFVVEPMCVEQKRVGWENKQTEEWNKMMEIFFLSETFFMYRKFQGTSLKSLC